MNSLLNQINRFNRWYDALPGSPRFLLFMAAMTLAIVPLQVGLELGIRSMTMVGFTGLCIMTAVATVRATNLGGRHVVLGFVMLLMLGLVGLGAGR